MSILRRLSRPLLGRTWKSLTFPSEGFLSIPADTKIEEETLPDYLASRFYPARIGEVLKERYQLVGKLGYGATATVWLARDLEARKHVAVKLFIDSSSMGSQLDTELEVYERIEKSSRLHPGRSAIRRLLESFHLQGPRARHLCLVHPALWESILDFKNRNPVQRLPVPMIAFILKRLFDALDLLHTECRVAHTDIKESNILLAADDSVLTEFEARELKEPCPRKEGPDRAVYVSRELNMPRNVGGPVLCDLGSAVILEDVEQREDIQPDIYRAPEIILDVPWTYSVDIWNAGCMIWDAFEGESLFSGKDPEVGTYRGRAHLAEMIALLGNPPQSLLERANLKSKFFSDGGEWNAGIPLLEPRSLEVRETTLAQDEHVEDRQAFLRLMRKMLQWEPQKRSSARELSRDEWIMKHT